MKHAIRKIHFIGVGGSGMSGIAEVSNLARGDKKVPRLWLGLD